MPLSAPDIVKVMVHNSTLAEVHWEPVSSPTVRGKLQGYKVLFDKWLFMQHVLVVVATLSSQCSSDQTQVKVVKHT